MTGRIVTCDHKIYNLPSLLDWEILLTGSVPCDSFSVTCLWSPEMARSLRDAASFFAWDGGTLMLRGFVDEYEVCCDDGGSTVTITGRGLAGRLLDNESRPVTYAAASLRDIVRAHVTPYGISCGKCADVRAAAGYTVSSGTSQWKALEGFCRAYGGFAPSFRPDGTLVAAPEDGGTRRVIDAETPLLSLRLRESRYGVLSEVLVIDKTRNVSYSVQNRDLMDRGGQCRRVIYTPGQSTWSAMRYTGEYQIARSREDAASLTVLLPGTASVLPGDTAVVELTKYGLAGEYRVSAVEYRCSDAGQTTELTLSERAG